MTEATEAPATPKPTRIAPIVTLDSKSFWDAADREEFVGQKCGDCGQFTFPPRPMCPHCHSLARVEVKLSGYGTVHSYTIPRHPHPFGFKEAPVVAVILLDEGIRFVSNVVGVTPEDMKFDMPVEVMFEPTMNQHKLPVFRPRSTR
ncbi:MAG: Zn-ribbon OB-fold protein [Hydrocarboniphaga sp.]|uniref:Zn-ribbon domain-containing OB-fold protein n=1 Tax=Hydrocarboniphaga sp. TaxID=2033016 RepID=UPI00262559B9|nr:Zn-ribbon domain-containing OB-fold protein [Hydrocarboniphaga sp.]MDB5972532.1 Zn-ribbon OB-fold protein [Hydrocarboniphaga sp.]